MTRDLRGVWIGSVLVALVGAAGCSKAEKAPPPAAETRQAAPDTTAPAPYTSPALEALTKAKASDQDFMQAITAIEGANAVADAAAAAQAKDRHVLGIPHLDAPATMPGVSLPRERFPSDVRVVRMEGFDRPVLTKYHQRYQMLATMYATKYNAEMLRLLDVR